jgi:hypothetical protein
MIGISWRLGIKNTAFKRRYCSTSAGIAPIAFLHQTLQTSPYAKISSGN